MEQRCTDLSFQVRDLLAERRLANAELCSRPGEMELLGNRQKIAYVTELKLMMQTEVGEANEPYIANRGSSSTGQPKR